MQFKVPGDDEVYTLIENKFTFGEARAIEKVTGKTITQITEPENQDVTAMQAMFWISMKRKRPTIAFVELDDMPIDEIEYLPEAGEVAVDEEGAEAGPTSPATEPVASSSEPSEVASSSDG